MNGLNLTTGCNTFELIKISAILLKINFGVAQGLVLGFLIFFLYRNDLHNSNRFSSPFHFADDTGLLNIQDSMRNINKTLNKDTRELSFWLKDTLKCNVL